MNLTPTEQLHYDAISTTFDSLMPNLKSYESRKIKVIQACAKITEREKLLFAIERLNIILNKGWHMFPSRTIIPKWMQEIESEIEQLQQQLNKLIA